MRQRKFLKFLVENHPFGTVYISADEKIGNYLIGEVKINFD